MIYANLPLTQFYIVVMYNFVRDGTAHTLTLRDAKDKEIGQWHANNVVDHRATLRFVPDRVCQINASIHPRRNGGDAHTLDGKYGRFGTIRLPRFDTEGRVHSGVGIHTGRANRGGADHATMGCIRTVDEAMAAITQHMRDDPLGSISVRENCDQRNMHQSLWGDHHQHGHRAQSSRHDLPGIPPMS